MQRETNYVNKYVDRINSKLLIKYEKRNKIKNFFYLPSSTTCFSLTTPSDDSTINILEYNRKFAFFRANKITERRIFKHKNSNKMVKLVQIINHSWCFSQYRFQKEK